MPRLSTSSWSLHRALGRPPLTGPGSARPDPIPTGPIALLEAPARLAQAGIGTLEIVHFHFPSTDPGYLSELRGELERAGIELFSVLIDAGDITHPDPGTRSQHLAWIRGWIDVAGVLGASHARVIAGDAVIAPDSGELAHHPAIQLSAQNLGELARYAAQSDVQVITENFRALTSRADQVLAILELCDHAVGLCADFGNFKGEKKAAELSAIFPFADSAHAKADYREDFSLIREDFVSSLDGLTRTQFDGPISLIFDSPMAPGTDEWDNLAVLRQIVAPYVGL